MTVLPKLLKINRLGYYLLFLSLCGLICVRLGLWLLPFQVLRKWLTRLNSGHLHNVFSVKPSIRKIVWAIHVSSRVMPGNVKCLARALTTQWVANQFGYQLDFHIGVAKDNASNLEAHAWVIYNDQVVMGHLPDLDRFVPLLLVSGVPK